MAQETAEPPRRSPCSPRTSGCSGTASASSPTPGSGRWSARWTSRPGCPRTLIDAAVRARRHGHRDARDATAAPARRFFHSVLAVEELSRVDPSVGVLVDVQNTLVINALLRWGSDDLKQRYLPRLASDTRRRLRAVGSRLGQRRLRADHARARGRRRLRPERPQAVDHQRQRGRRLHRLRDGRSRRPATAASPRSSSSAALPGSRSARRKTSSASAPAAPASCSSTTAACRGRTCSARSARATRSRSRR